MKKKLLNLLMPIAFLASIGMNGQARYLNEVFTDTQIETTKDVTYGVNIGCPLIGGGKKLPVCKYTITTLSVS